LPVESALTFTVRLSQLAPEERVQWERHKVTKGQTLSHIARKYRTTVAVLKDVNEIRSDRIRAGQHLLIPVSSKGLDQYTLSADERRRKLRTKRRAGIKKIHTVRTGDTLWDLSRKYNVKVRSLAGWNSMAPGDTLKTGQKLVIWHNGKGKSAGVHSALQSIHYTVRKGDSLHRISARFKVSVNDLIRWNSIRRNAYLHPGQRLKLYVDVREQTDS
jgi:membrane-bound lytic murein transglycosylase D